MRQGLGVLCGRRVFTAFMLAAAAVLLGACGPELPRAWREARYGPDATPTALLHTTPPAAATSVISLPTAPPQPTRQPTLTTAPTRTATPTHTPTATPAIANLTLQQGVPWYVKGRMAPYDGCEDTYISAWSRNGNFAGAPALSIRQGDVMAALLYFHLGDLPATTAIYHAEIGFYVSVRSNDTPMTITVRPLLKPWLLTEATWLHANQALLWQTPGANGETDRLADSVAELVADERGAWLSFDATELVQAWLRDPQANQGLLLSGDADNAVQYDLVSADSRDERHRPRLTLTFPTGAIALAPPKVVSATPSATATANLDRPQELDISRMLPSGSAVLARAMASVSGASRPDIVVVYRTPGALGINAGVFYYPAGAAAYRLYWSSAEMAGTGPISLDLADLTGDGAPEILVGVGNPSASGRMLYVFTSQPKGFRLLLPGGGYFAGKDHFGETWFELSATRSDGRVDILARHGGQTDVYTWDGVNFVAAVSPSP